MTTTEDPINGLATMPVGSPEWCTWATREIETLRLVAGEAYQVIGTLAAATGTFDDPQVTKALDYFSGSPDGTLLSWSVSAKYPASMIEQFRLGRLEEAVRRLGVWAWGANVAPDFPPIYAPSLPASEDAEPESGQE